MADTGFLFAGTGQTVGIGDDWFLASTITSDDGFDATITIPELTLADSLEGRSFGFSIPAGATIDGVEFELVDFAGEQEGAS